LELRFPRPLFSAGDYNFARRAIAYAADGAVYRGYSLPGWYSPDDLLKLLAAAPAGVAPSAVVGEVFGLTVKPFEPTTAWAEAFIRQHDSGTRDAIGELGEDAIGGHYKPITGSTVIDGAVIPFCVEAWVTAVAMERGEDYYTPFNPLINRSPALAELRAYANQRAAPLWLRSRPPPAGSETRRL